MRFAIFDIDGVLMQITPERLRCLQRTVSDMDGFNMMGRAAEPIRAMTTVARCLAEDGFLIVLMTGCSDKWREDRIAWLREHDVPFHLLLMRKEGDHRSDVKLKREWLVPYMTHEVLFIAEDRDHLVKEFRDLGFTVLQPSPGVY